MIFEFDKLGYLQPYHLVECDLDDLKANFVDAFPLSNTRQGLWNYYIQYVDDLQQHITPHFAQWIDGSFITQALDPKDIDLVTFIDTQVFKEKESDLEGYWSFALEDQGLDAYLVEVYQENSDQYQQLTVHYRNLWLNRFGKDREGKPKGLIQIKF
jgi:hypothetical protein